MPEPPYIAVIFTAFRTEEDAAGYAEAAARMDQRAREMPGYLGLQSARDAEGFGLSVSYWADLAAVARWKVELDHLEVQEIGRERWYAWYETRVATVMRQYDWVRKFSN